MPYKHIHYFEFINLAIRFLIIDLKNSRAQNFMEIKKIYLKFGLSNQIRYFYFMIKEYIFVIIMCALNYALLSKIKTSGRSQVRIPLRTVKLKSFFFAKI